MNYRSSPFFLLERVFLSFLSLSLSLRRGLSPKIFGEWNFLGALLLSIRTGRCVAFHIRNASIAIIQHSRRIESLLAPPHFLPSPLGPVSRNDISQTGHNFSAQERERSDSCFYFFLKRNGILVSRVFIPSKGSQFGFLDGIRFSTVNSLWACNGGKKKNVRENETADEKNSLLCYLTSEMPINLKLVGWITRSRSWKRLETGEMSISETKFHMQIPHESIVLRICKHVFLTPWLAGFKFWNRRNIFPPSPTVEAVKHMPRSFLSGLFSFQP